MFFPRKFTTLITENIIFFLKMCDFIILENIVVFFS